MNMQTQLFDLETQYEQAMDEAARTIKAGGLVVFPTETVYGIGADAMDPAAVANIFKVKGRPSDNPLIVHICDFAQVEQLAAEVSPLAKKLMEAFWPGPFTAVVKCKSTVPACVTGGLHTVGIRMP
ncbi:MAG: threonylcarbamoyl-AMP synthase, partial [Christensenellaceae bacterium]|nr:threonylcarbamoyl-AMP synthase [Christensenellaceae bacterium]